jgi:putative ubiquitin-RnfH superfamily antitoxin RatB of RatAB toxin-antitoxin module
MAAERAMVIEVVYCLSDEHHIIEVTVRPGATVRDAVRLSGLAETYPEIDQPTTRVGVYGRVVADDTLLRDGDRVEIYRPLVADPKQSRRRRAAREP